MTSLDTSSHIIDWDERRTRFTDLLLSRDRAGAADLVADLLDQGAQVHQVYLRLFARSQEEIGRRWQRNEVTVAQEHYCTAATQVILSGLYPRVFETEPDGRRAVMACLANELHEFGARMVADLLQLDGWDVSYLGASVPTQDIVALAADEGADLVAISVTMPDKVPGLSEVITALRRELDHPPAILVGGRPFNIAEGLWAKVDADGHGRDAREAVEAAASLVPRPGGVP